MAASPSVVAAVEAIPVSVPLETPIQISTREIKARQYVVVFVSTSDGLVGSGYTYVGTSGAQATAHHIREDVAPLLLGLPAWAPSRPWATLYRELILVGRRGLGLRAISAVDLALWDLAGRRADLPVGRMLGGVRDRVPAYASGGYYGAGDPLQRVHDELARYIAKGFSDFKIKVGGLDFATDVARVKVARETVGPDARLALDANNAWATPAEAVRFGLAVAECDPWWLEEPLTPDNIPGHGEVGRRLPYPVATGEIHASRWEFRDLLSQPTISIIQPDAGVMGGVSEWMRVAHAAETFGVPVAPHWNANLHIQLASAVEGCLALEYFALEEDIFNFERLVTRPLVVTDGMIDVPVRPGLGLEFDDAALREFRMSPTG